MGDAETVQPGRQPRLRQGADDLTVREFSATADGLCARILLGDEDLTEARISETLRHALREH